MLFRSILSTKLDKTSSKIPQTRHWFQFQFSFSVFIMLVLISGGVFYFYRLQREEKFSTQLISNYNISRLYNNQNNIAVADNENGLFRYYPNS